jgi:DmsE family decaheme c-type cytochrome
VNRIRMKFLLVVLVGVAVSANHVIAKDIDWAALNPAFEGATFVKDPNACFTCHENSQDPFSHTAHAKAFKHGKVPAVGDCESCHGPRSKHVKDGTSFKLTTTQQSSVCMQCHEGGDRKHWTNGAHASSEVGCTSCHTVMQKKSERNLLAASREDATCYTCHADVRGEMNKPSHHPVREGKVSCSGCHEPHGSVNTSLLKGASINETCFKCHQEKRGPFVWQHAPVIESCLTCHNTHGSTNRKLLNSKESFLCMQCHTYGGHINLPRYNRTSNPYGEGCVNCHMAIHGSNSPSGRKLTR